jgi:hypothetical protein
VGHATPKNTGNSPIAAVFVGLGMEKDEAAEFNLPRQKWLLPALEFFKLITDLAVLKTSWELRT